ncbi:MAG: tyrosine-type recombinase/integrase [Candidatus Freyarchaeota archaeon]
MAESRNNQENSHSLKDSSIQEFLRERSLRGLSGGTLTNYRVHLKRFADFLGRDPRDASKAEILNFMEWVKGKYAYNTFVVYCRSLSAYYNWLGRLSDLRKQGVKFPSRIRETVTKSDLPDEEELLLMLRKAPNYRDRAILSLLWETGLRVGELCSLNIGDIIATEYGYDIVVRESKTQTRTIPVVKSARYLADWLNFHPLREDPGAPLFVTFAPNLPPGTRLTKVGVNRVLKKIAKRAGVKKEIHPHLLRHARLTELSTVLTEPVLRRYAGWSPASPMVRRYIHLSGADVKDAVLEAHGLKPPKYTEVMPLRECPRCRARNESLNEYCAECGYPLVKDQPIVVRDLSKVQELERELEELKRDFALELQHQINAITSELQAEFKKQVKELMQLIAERGG